MWDDSPEKGMRCIVCGADEAYWVSLTMDNEEEGYETYACPNCRSNSEYGIKIEKLVYTGRFNAFPFEEE